MVGPFRPPPTATDDDHRERCRREQVERSGSGLDEHVDGIDDQPTTGEHRLPGRLLDRRDRVASGAQLHDDGDLPGKHDRRHGKGHRRAARDDPRRVRTRCPTRSTPRAARSSGVVCIIGSVAICTAATAPRSSPSNAATIRSGTRRGRLRNGRSWSTMLDHPGAAQRGVRREPPASGDVGERETCETQCEPDRGPPLGDVVVEIAEQLLVARVEVRSGGDQEQIEIDLVEVESFRQGLEAANRRESPANHPPTGLAGRRVRSASLVGRTPRGHVGRRSRPDRRVDRQ